MNLVLPMRCQVSGPSQSGKSSLVRKLLFKLPEYTGHRHFRFIWCLAEKNSLPPDLPKGTAVHVGIPDFDSLARTTPKNVALLIILDDLMTEGGRDENLAQVFTRKSHHNNIPINYFYNSKYF